MYTVINIYMIDVNKLMDQGLTNQETIRAMFMGELKKNKSELNKSS